MRRSRLAGNQGVSPSRNWLLHLTAFLLPLLLLSVAIEAQEPRGEEPSGTEAQEPRGEEPSGTEAPSPGEVSWKEEPYGYEGRFVSRGEITAAPTAVGELAVVASADRRLYALEPGGAIRWRSELGGRAVTPVAVAGGETLAALTDAGELSLFDQLDGRRIWSRKIRGPAVGEARGSSEGGVGGAHGSLPALITEPEGLIILATGDSRILAYSLSGAFLWKWELPVAISAAPIMGHHGHIVVPTEEGRVTAFTRGGALRWTTFLDGPATDLALTREGYLALEGGWRLRRIDREGLLKGSFPVPGPGGSGASAARIGVDREGNVVLAYQGGGVTVVDSRGRERWTEPEAREFTLLADGVLLGLPGGRGELRTPGGRLLWELRSEGEVRDLAPLERHFLVIYGDWVMSWYRAQGVTAVSEEKVRTGEGPADPRRGSGEYDGWLPERGNRERTGGRLLGGEPERGEAPVLFRELLRSPERSDRRRLLEAIEKRAAEGGLTGIYRDVREITGEIALEPHIRPRSDAGNDWPELRSRAALLLGGWGDLPSWRDLLQLIRRERELSVLLAALEGLSRIPYDRNGQAARTLADAASRWSRSSSYPVVAEAILDAMAALETSPGEEAAAVYAQIARGDLPRETRRRAGRLMRTHFENHR